MIRSIVAELLNILPIPMVRAYRRISWFRHYEHQIFPFSNVYIETSGACSRACEYCPVSILPKRNGRISDEVISSIINQLKDLNYKGSVGFHFINEPMLDKRLFKIIKSVKEVLPEVSTILVSNGDVLDVEKITELFDESNLDSLQLSAHDQKAYTKFENILNQISVEKREKIYIKKMFKSEGEVISIHSFAGSIEENADKYAVERVPLSGCDLRIFTIDYKGLVHGCCADGLGDYIIGNINEESILEIATKSKSKIRGHFTGDFTNSACHRCVHGS